jgi:hypothetical protein
VGTWPWQVAFLTVNCAEKRSDGAFRGAEHGFRLRLTTKILLDQSLGKTKFLDLVPHLSGPSWDQAMAGPMWAHRVWGKRSFWNWFRTCQVHPGTRPWQDPCGHMAMASRIFDRQLC